MSFNFTELIFGNYSFGNYTDNATDMDEMLNRERLKMEEEAALILNRWMETFSFVCSIFLIILSSAAFLVNTYLLICSHYLRRPIGVNLRLCVSLTASNALCAFFYILTFTMNVIIKSSLSMCFILLIEVGKYSTFFASVFTLLALALNHYVGIVYPLKRHAITPKTVRFAMVLSYFVPFGFFLALFCIHPGGFGAGDHPFAFFKEDGCMGAYIFKSAHFRFMVVFPFFAIVSTLSFLYIHILVHMGRSQKDPLLQTHSKSNKTKRSSNRKLLVTLILLAGSACLGWLPTIVQFVFTCDSCILPLGLRWRAVSGAISIFLHILKLLMDAFIYSSRLIEIRYSMFVFCEEFKNRLRKIVGLRYNTTTLPSEFSRYLSETKENRSMRRKNTAMLTISSKSEPVAKRASSVVMMGSNGKNHEIPLPQRSNTLHPTRKSSTPANTRSQDV